MQCHLITFSQHLPTYHLELSTVRSAILSTVLAVKRVKQQRLAVSILAWTPLPSIG